MSWTSPSATSSRASTWPFGRSGKSSMNADRCPYGEDATAFVDDELPPGDATAFEAHLAGCAECRRAITTANAVFNRLRAVPAVESSRDLVPGILASIREEPVTPRRSAAMAWAAAAAAAVLLLGVAL